MTEWPKQGLCGACGRPAVQIPSGKWWHEGRPCRARFQSIWRMDDFEIKDACRFIPDGEPLPTAPDWHLHPEEVTAQGIPTAFGVCRSDHMPTVREFLAREAEEGIRG